MTPPFKLFITVAAIAALAISSMSEASQCPRFSWSQKYILELAYRTGEPMNMGESLRAIVFLESSAGVNLANNRTLDYGLAGIHLKTAVARFPGTTPERLMYDHTFNLLNSAIELDYWLGRTNGNWLESWARYNGGNRLSKRNWEYAQKVRKTIRLFRKCL